VGTRIPQPCCWPRCRFRRLELQGRQLRLKVLSGGLQVATRGFNVLSGRLDISAEVLTKVTRHPFFEFSLVNIINLLLLFVNIIKSLYLEHTSVILVITKGIMTSVCRFQ
jgi:hypothetical protein